MKKLKLYIEEWLPSATSFALIILLYTTSFNFLELGGIKMSVTLAIVIIAFLLTHKSIILTINNEKHAGLKKLLKADKMTKRFFNYLHYPIYTSILIIIFTIIHFVFNSVEFHQIETWIYLYLTFLLIFQAIRFFIVFNIVVIKSLKI